MVLTEQLPLHRPRGATRESERFAHGTRPFEDAGLLEREGEIETLVSGIASVRRGRGRIVILEGPSGIGKTQLLGEARQEALRHAMVVLSARGALFEQDFPFGVVRQLFEPALARAPQEERRRLLAGAAGLATHAIELAGERDAVPPLSDPSFSALHGLYWLAVNLTESYGPACLLIDDIHWSDPASLNFLGFLARRLDELPILLCAAVRTGEPGPQPALMAELIRGSTAASIQPRPLSLTAVTTLAEARFRTAVPNGFAAACHEMTGGNPSLLRELFIALADEGVAPVELNIPRVRQIGPSTISQAVLVRLARKPAPALTLAESIAILGDEIELEAAAALAGLDADAAGKAADALAEAEILERRLPLSFVHPVVRAAIYNNLPVARRSDLHRRAAVVLHDGGAPPGVVASHFLLTSPAGDPAVGAVLRDAGVDALERGAPAAAVSYLRRALREPVSPDLRSAALLELGMAEARLGLAVATGTLEEAVETATSPTERSHAALECARALMMSGRARDGVQLLERIGARLRHEAPDAASVLEAEQLISMHAFRSVRERLAIHIGKLEQRADVDGTGDRVLLAVAAIEEACAGDSPARAIEHARRALGNGDLLAVVGPEAASFYQAACALSLAGRSEEAISAVTQALELAGKLGSVAAFAIASTARGWFNFHRGALQEAEADIRQALAVDSAGWQLVLPMALGTLVEVLIEHNRLEGAAQLVSRPMAGPATESVLFEIFLGARGRLQVATGRLADALEDFFEVGARQRSWGATTPSVFTWRSNAALVQSALGERAHAAELAEAELLLARNFGAGRMVGPALRAAGLVAEGDEQIGFLEAAVDVLVGSEARLEHARALVDLGAALRRQNHRTAAREPLRLGLDLAHRCGAVALQRRAHEELVGAGGRPRRELLTGPDALTASERRIMTMAREGMANKAIAQALFLSLRTVEFHLSNAYRKLGVTSRAELQRRAPR
jgi:DNA-binding CsgD family transcriptional regulator